MLASDNRDINLVFDPLQRFSEIPGMCIAVTARGQVFDTELFNCTGLRTKIRNVYNDESFCHFRVEQGKNKMGSTKAPVFYFHIVGK